MKRLLKVALSLTGKGQVLKYCIMGIISGLINFLFIRSVTRIIGLIMSEHLKGAIKENILILAGIILLFVIIRRTLSLGIIKLSQTLFWKLRKQTLSLVLIANYQQLSSRRVRIRSTMLGDVSSLTEASLNIITFFSAFILSISCFIYLLSISGILFLITLCVSAAGIFIYRSGILRNTRRFRKTRELENKFQESFYAILDGFKELYMEPRKGRTIYNEKISVIARDAFSINTNAYAGFLNNQITGQVLFYMLISSILLYFSIALNIKPGNTVSFVFTLLYLVGSLETIMVLFPGLMRARVAADHLMDLQSELEESNFNNPIPRKYISKEEFDQVTVRGLEFHYDEQDNSFGIGPIDLDIQKGEVVFIYGGNGSGKTTLIYSILGLCFPSAGEIRLNSVLVDADNYAEYRTAFSVVFNDFYLFNEILGMPDLDVEKWDFYLHLFELDGKVKLEECRLSTTDLSTGQRKRLALMVELMEEKPVLVIDEWAADQDPHFRKKFYTEIIPLLKKDNITILAITHDDKYYYCADRLYKMDYGKLIPESINIFAI
jgi:cyclic peptide transporter